jgi:hypothetical protein
MTDDHAISSSQDLFDAVINVFDLSKINDYRTGQLVTTSASLVTSTRVIVPKDYPKTRESRDKLLLLMNVTDPISGFNLPYYY